jgi:hypothetical protein
MDDPVPPSLHVEANDRSHVIAQVSGYIYVDSQPSHADLGVALAVGDGEVSVDREARFSVEIHNRGRTPRRLALQVAGELSPEVIRVEPAEVLVKPGRSAPGEVVLRCRPTVPEADEWELSVVAIDVDRPNEVGRSAVKKIRILPRPMLELRPVSAVPDRHGRSEMTFLLINTGNTRLSGTVRAENQAQAQLNVSVNLAPDREVEITFEADPGMAPLRNRWARIAITADLRRGADPWRYDLLIRQIGMLTVLGEYVRRTAANVRAWSAEPVTIERGPLLVTAAVLIVVAILVSCALFGVVGAHSGWGPAPFPGISPR